VGEVFDDDDVAATMIDHLVHHAEDPLRQCSSDARSWPSLIGDSSVAGSYKRDQRGWVLRLVETADVGGSPGGRAQVSAG
jgi:hypothetical protein